MLTLAIVFSVLFMEYGAMLHKSLIFTDGGTTSY